MKMSDTPETDANCCAATPEELCDSTLKHYDDISTKACHWNNQVPQAIRFWYLEKPILDHRLQDANKHITHLAGLLREAEQDAERYRLVRDLAIYDLDGLDGLWGCAIADDLPSPESQIDDQCDAALRSARAGKEKK